jgi:hypothetical protein
VRVEDSSFGKRQACLGFVAELHCGGKYVPRAAGFADMALKAFHHGRAFCCGGGSSFARIHGQHDGIWPNALGDTDTDAVEPGDLGEAGNACGVKMRPHALQRLLWSAGAVGSFKADFLC